MTVRICVTENRMWHTPEAFAVQITCFFLIDQINYFYLATWQVGSLFLFTALMKHSLLLQVIKTVNYRSHS